MAPVLSFISIDDELLLHDTLPAPAETVPLRVILAPEVIVPGQLVILAVREVQPLTVNL